MSSVLVVGVHLDDETLGCGGTLLKHAAKGDSLHWLLVTEPTRELNYDESRLLKRQQQIEQVQKMYNFSTLGRLGFPAARLDTIPRHEIIKKISKFFHETQPQTVYLPFAHDVHGDHHVAFKATFAAAKSFRAPFIERMLAMETISETEFAPPLPGNEFQPNVFVDIGPHFSKKLEILKIFSEEFDPHPFPRSLEHVRALAIHRGATAGYEFAEAFQLLKERI